MGFDRRDIRTMMDVYTLDNVYLGTVLAIIAGSTTAGAEDLVPAAQQSSAFSGELLGPVPTQASGNRGPITQAAARLYHTARDGAAPLGNGAIKVGKWWGLLGRRIIALDQIQTVSLERVILKQRKADLDRRS